MTSPQDSSPAWPLNGRTAVVTGATSGIGRAIIGELGRAGAACVLHGRRPEVVEQVTAEFAEQLPSLHSTVFDLREHEAYEDFVEQTWRDFGPLDIWVNNAGADVLTGARAQDSFEDKMRLLWEVDLVSTVRLSRLVGTKMKKVGRGTIVNIGWDQAEQGMAGDSGELFATIKGGIMAFSRSLAQSLAPEVRVLCVAPGWIRTAWGNQASEAWQRRARRECLLDRWGTPEDVARVVRFVVSEEAAFVNGQIIPVNGGFRWNSS